MTSLALDLHQVLEDEYISMYGPLERASPLYNEDDILNSYQVRVILQECLAARLSELVSGTASLASLAKSLQAVKDNQEIAALLSELVSGTASLASFAESPAITDCGTRLLEDYDELRKLAEEKDSRVSLQELRRTIID